MPTTFRVNQLVTILHGKRSQTAIVERVDRDGSIVLQANDGRRFFRERDGITFTLDANDNVVGRLRFFEVQA